MSTENSVTNDQIQNLQIVFYDGECGFCSWSVQTIHRLDSESSLCFAPLQGETAARLLPENDRVELSTLIYLKPDAQPKKRSTAVIEILRQTGGFLGFLSPIGYIIPKTWRDALYDFIAKRRKKILGYDTCQLPSRSLQAQMLP